MNVVKINFLILFLLFNLTFISTNEKKTLKSHIMYVSSAVFSFDEKYIFSVFNNTTEKLWDIAAGKIIKNYSDFDGAVSTVAFSPDGKYFLSGSADGTIKLYCTSLKF